MYVNINANIIALHLYESTEFPHMLFYLVYPAHNKHLNIYDICCIIFAFHINILCLFEILLLKTYIQLVRFNSINDLSWLAFGNMTYKLNAIFCHPKLIDDNKFK